MRSILAIVICCAVAPALADDAKPANSVMEPIETGGFELRKSIGNDAAPRTQLPIEPPIEVNVETVRQKMAAAKTLRVANQLVDLEPDCRVVGRDDGSGAHTDNRINRNAVPSELSKHAGVRRPAQPAGAEHEAHTHTF